MSEQSRQRDDDVASVAASERRPQGHDSSPEEATGIASAREAGDQAERADLQARDAETRQEVARTDARRLEEAEGEAAEAREQAEKEEQELERKQAEAREREERVRAEAQRAREQAEAAARQAREAREGVPASSIASAPSSSSSPPPASGSLGDRLAELPFGDRPEIQAGIAFATAFLLAKVLKSLGR